MAGLIIFLFHPLHLWFLFVCESNILFYVYVGGYKLVTH